MMKILFIGNSHTYCHGLPFQIRELVRQTNRDIETAMCATGGMTLGWHSEQPETQMAIQYHEWDYIVLQQKTHPFDGADMLLRDCKSLLPFTRKTQAKILLFMTWAEKRIPANQLTLDRAFLQAAEEIKATPVPVSKAWQSVLRSEPDIELYEPDGEHSSPHGSYLAACVFFAVIQKCSPVGLPGRICINGDELVNLSREHAEKIQRAAWLATQD
jgi:hypothetical protein